MSRLRPSARLNRRYLLVEGTEKTLEKALLSYLGILGWSKAAPAFLKGNGSKIIVAVNREELTNVRAAIGLSGENLTIIKVSGTIKGLGTSAKLKYDIE